MKEGKLNKRPVSAKNWKTFLGGGKEGTKSKLGNDYVNKSLKSTGSLFKDMADIIKKNEKFSKISIDNIVIILHQLNIFFTLSKKPSVIVEFFLVRLSLN